jgi:Negative regulator of sigma F
MEARTVNSAATTQQRVRRAIADDLRPVRPLWSPLRRVIVLLPVAIVLALFAASKYGPRKDAALLGGLVTWGLSSLEWTLGLLLLGVGLRHAVPGYGMSRRRLVILCGVTVAVILSITFVTYAIHPTFVPTTRQWRVWTLCVLGPLEFGVPLLLVASVLSARAFPTRPAAVGALCGFAAGIVVDSGWRLTCWISDPTHVFGAHFLALTAMVAIGAGLSTAIDWVRRAVIYPSNRNKSA